MPISFDSSVYFYIEGKTRPKYPKGRIEFIKVNGQPVTKGMKLTFFVDTPLQIEVGVKNVGEASGDLLVYLNDQVKTVKSVKVNEWRTVTFSYKVKQGTQKITIKVGHYEEGGPGFPVL